MNTILERVLKIKDGTYTREQWGLRLHLREKYPDQPESYWTPSPKGRKGLYSLLIDDRIQAAEDNGSSVFDTVVSDLFIQCIRELGLPYRLSAIDNQASYDDVEQIFDLVIKYAKNWAFA